MTDVDTKAEADKVERRFESNIDRLDALRRHCLAHGWIVQDDEGDSMPYAFTAMQESVDQVTTIYFDLDEEGRLDLSKHVVSRGSTRLLAEAWIEGLV